MSEQRWAIQLLLFFNFLFRMGKLIEKKRVDGHSAPKTKQGGIWKLKIFNEASTVWWMSWWLSLNCGLVAEELRNAPQREENKPTNSFKSNKKKEREWSLIEEERSWWNEEIFDLWMKTARHDEIKRNGAPSESAVRERMESNQRLDKRSQPSWWMEWTGGCFCFSLWLVMGRRPLCRLHISFRKTTLPSFQFSCPFFSFAAGKKAAH